MPGPLTIHQLIGRATVPVEVYVGDGLDRPCQKIRLLFSRAAPEKIDEGTLVIATTPLDPLSPAIDSLLVTLDRLRAAGLVLPSVALPESTRLVADRVGFPVMGVALENMSTLVESWWTLLYLNRLVALEDQATLQQSLLSVWNTAATTEDFLAKVGALMGAEIRVVEDGEGLLPLRPEEEAAGRVAIEWGRGRGSALEVWPQAGTGALGDHLMPLVGTLAGILMDREAREVEAELRLRGELLLDLLREGATTGSVVEAAERLGMDLGDNHVVVFWTLDDPSAPSAGSHPSEVKRLRMKRDAAGALEGEARSRFRRAWVLPHADALVLVTSIRDQVEGPERLAAWAKTVRERAVTALGPASRELTAGVGSCYSGPSGLRKSFDEAREALLVGRAQFGAGSVTHFKDLGLHRFLYGWFDTPRSMSVARDFLRPILEESEETRGTLLRTLRVYLHSGGRTSVAARSLGMHRNSVRYRLHRIEELLNVDLSDPDVQTVLQLVLRTLPD